MDQLGTHRHWDHLHVGERHAVNLVALIFFAKSICAPVIHPLYLLTLNEPTPTDVKTGKRLIPFQATDDFVAFMDGTVESVREREVQVSGEAVTDRSKFIRAAIREKAERFKLSLTTPEAA